MGITSGIVGFYTHFVMQSAAEVSIPAADHLIRAAIDQLSIETLIRTGRRFSGKKMDAAGFSKLDTIGLQKYFDSV